MDIKGVKELSVSIHMAAPPDKVMGVFRSNLDPNMEVKIDGLTAAWNPDLWMENGKPVVHLGPNMRFATLTLEPTAGGTTATYKIMMLGKMGMMQRLMLSRSKSEMSRFLQLLKAGAERA